MSQQQWNSVDDYFTGLLAPADEALSAALRDSDAAGLPHISVTPNQGKLLQLLAQVQGARRILEIGTLGGYSTIWLARALPADGRLITLEHRAEHAAVAHANIARAGLDKLVDIRVGPALDSLAEIGAEHAKATGSTGGAGNTGSAGSAEDIAPFDLVFIDADKVNNPHYVEWAVKLTRPGSLIVLDNVVRGGAVADPASTDPNVRGTRAALELMAEHPKLSATAVQTVGSKGYDGFALARVLD
ncbi:MULTISPECIES: O-methyltransferase [unclassified Streptomyces]|uniref:O-methyltransferase n=1 Tax=unclassified Streptomyces TaxID=2593676 RepID=UPI000748E499|nr:MULTISPECIES: O-methyltransferase [unclassified Streptomyces]KUL51341.1 methyltransferase [Streptomyces sp. NRRL S-1521]THC54092.1 O-methyltransferase [Streptomyces sp. A1499]